MLKRVNTAGGGFIPQKIIFLRRRRHRKLCVQKARRESCGCRAPALKINGDVTSTLLTRVMENFQNFDLIARSQNKLLSLRAASSVVPEGGGMCISLPKEEK
jgi:hypothetical protein